MTIVLSRLFIYVFVSAYTNMQITCIGTSLLIERRRVRKLGITRRIRQGTVICTRCGHDLYEQDISPPTILLGHTLWKKGLDLRNITPSPDLCLSFRPLYAGFRSDMSWKTRLKRQRQVLSSYQTPPAPSYFMHLPLWGQINLKVRNENCLCWYVSTKLCREGHPGPGGHNEKQCL